MKLSDKFFEDLCELAQRYGIKEIGTSVIRTGGREQDVTECVIFSDEVSNSSQTPNSVWQIQNDLEAFCIQRERFPIRTDANRRAAKVIGPGSDGHRQQLQALGDFLGLEEIRYVDQGHGEDYALVRRDSQTMTILVRGNRDQGGFLVVDGV